MQLLNDFGIDPVLFVAQIINFLLIMYILKRFAYKPILALLKKRELQIKQGIKDAENARLLLEQTQAKEKEIFEKAGIQTNKMLDAAAKERVILAKKAEEETKKRVDEMISDARSQIAFESTQMEKRISSKVTTLAVDFLQQALKDVFSENEQEIIMKQAVKKLSKKN